MIRLGEHLLTSRDSGKKLLVPYVMAGMRPDWLDLVQAFVDAGADAIEIGIPFSDPVMDGPVIQDASVRALDAGTTPASALESLATIDVDVPLAVMTYVNLVYRFGFDEFAAACKPAGVSATILPDLPLDESSQWREVAEQNQIDPVMLVAPNTPEDRLKRVCEAARGFVYAVGSLGVTGERKELPASATKLAQRVKDVTSTPVLIGVGVSTPAQAAQAGEVADGVVVASTLMRRVNEGESVAQVAAVVAEFRAALDG